MAKPLKFIIAIIILAFAMPFLFDWVPGDVLTAIAAVGCVGLVTGGVLWAFWFLFTGLFGIPQPRIGFLERRYTGARRS